MFISRNEMKWKNVEMKKCWFQGKKRENIDFMLTRDGKDVDDLETSKMLISRKA